MVGVASRCRKIERALDVACLMLEESLHEVCFVARGDAECNESIHTPRNSTHHNPMNRDTCASCRYT